MDTDTAIRSRKTTKVLADRELPAGESSALLADLLALAGMAPFHRACDEQHRRHALRGIEPWRFHVLEAAQCRRLRTQIPSENAGKIPAMLAAARALILATWLPNPPSACFKVSETNTFEPTLGNMEHIAAASSAVQNLLLAATARGVANYWSSGGVLRSSAVFELLEIPQVEILLGAVFLFPGDTDDAEIVGSKLRSSRSSPHCWSRAVVLPE